MVAALPQPALESLSLRILELSGQPRRYRKGTLLIQKGDFGHTLFIVLAGRVKAYSSGSRDLEIVLGVYGPDEYLGEVSPEGGPALPRWLRWSRPVALS